MMLWEIPLWVILAFAGGVGQLFRVMQGVYKAVKKGEKIDPKRIFWTCAFAAFSGAVVGYFYPDWRAAFLAGYGATDFVEGIIKGITIQKEEKEEE